MEKITVIIAQTLVVCQSTCSCYS